MDLDLFLNHNLQGPLNTNEAEENIGATDLDNLNKICKKKKISMKTLKRLLKV